MVIFKQCLGKLINKFIHFGKQTLIIAVFSGNIASVDGRISKVPDLSFVKLGSIFFSTPSDSFSILNNWRRIIKKH